MEAYSRGSMKTCGQITATPTLYLPGTSGKSMQPPEPAINAFPSIIAAHEHHHLGVLRDRYEIDYF